MEYAYAKLQGLNGESFHIQNLPTKICRKVRRDKDDMKGGFESIGISDSHGIALCHCLLSYDEKEESFYIIPFGGVSIDNKFYNGIENADDVISDFFAKPPNDIEKYDEYKIKLNNYSKIYFPTDDTEVPLVFYLLLPGTGNISSFKKMHDSFMTPAKLASMNKSTDKLLSSKWSADDKEQLKKFILIYGYGRWKQIQEASKQIGGKLKDKSLSEVRAFANAFLRCITENLEFEKDDLKKYLDTIMEEYPGDPYILSNSKDWDGNLLKQRANPWAKRLQLLYRVRFIIKKFKEDQKRRGNPKSKDMEWGELLNFMSSSIFYGQRPAMIWTRKHDMDLLRGTYKYGYANYHLMKADPEYNLNELDRPGTYSEFPNADTITRRLKKLTQQIGKFEQKEEDLNFDEQNELELEGWDTEEKKMYFKFINNFGIPLNNEGKPNWLEMREKVLKEPGMEKSNKNITEIEKFADKLRIKCDQLANGTERDDVRDELADLNLGEEDAKIFNKNYDMLFFIRKAVLSNKMSLIKNSIEELKKTTQEMGPDEKGSVPENYDPGTHDRNILLYAADNGLNNLEKIAGNKEYEFDTVDMNSDKVYQRLDFIVDFFKNFINQQTSKKRRSDKPLKDETRKKLKFSLNKDDEGNIVFPLVINPSLTLLDCGVINTNPNYHSEHNLFPIGYKSVRSYASIFEKGKRAQYTNEILEGPDGKPLYRVTSSEDPDNPIVRDSSTGCWVYICHKVNDIADVKKQKVTISGTERFGLLEPNVCRILEFLPEAEKCMKYKFKYRVPENSEDA